jgi:hypothetical protein
MKSYVTEYGPDIVGIGWEVDVPISSGPTVRTYSSPATTTAVRAEAMRGIARLDRLRDGRSSSTVRRRF